MDTHFKMVKMLKMVENGGSAGPTAEVDPKWLKWFQNGSRMVKIVENG